MDANIKIAYLILCHKKFEQINLLIHQLDDGNCDFFVHIDKKSPKYNFNSSRVFSVADENRVDVKWGHVSMVYATINTMKLVKDCNKKYDYVFLISGQDFPLKSNIEIQQFLAQNSKLNYIQILDHTGKDYLRYSKRNSLKYCNFIMKRSFLSKVLKKLYIIITGGKNKTFKIFKRRNYLGVTFEFGSQWWALTYECFIWMMDYIECNPEYLKYYEKCLVPDESFFQTLFMNSPFKNSQKDFLTYLEWDKNNNNPRVFVNSDFDLLIGQDDKIFARKFDSSVDKSIVDKIIDKLGEKNDDTTYI